MKRKKRAKLNDAHLSEAGFCAERDQLAAACDIFKGRIRALEMERDEAHAMIKAHAEVVDQFRAERDEARAEGARLREALEACGYWLHPAGFNAERQRLFDRITNAVANSHSLWNFIREGNPLTDAQLDACQDCGATGQALYDKSDHHGGIKRVCADRDACHIRRPG